MFETSLDLALILIGTAFVAGFVDSIAGGGGLITLPVLLLARAELAMSSLYSCSPAAESLGSGPSSLAAGWPDTCSRALCTSVMSFGRSACSTLLRPT